MGPQYNFSFCCYLLVGIWGVDNLKVWGIQHGSLFWSHNNLFRCNGQCIHVFLLFLWRRIMCRNLFIHGSHKNKLIYGFLMSLQRKLGPQSSAISTIGTVYLCQLWNQLWWTFSLLLCVWGLGGGGVYEVSGISHQKCLIHTQQSYIPYADPTKRWMQNQYTQNQYTLHNPPMYHQFTVNICQLISCFFGG